MNYVRQIAYNVVFFAAFGVTCPYYLYRLWRRGNFWLNFGQRFGFYPPSLKARLKGGTDIWIHAVSVGEAMIATVLIRYLRDLNPGLKIVLSTTTATGYRVSKKLEDANTTVILNPTDFLWSARQAFEMIRPKRLVLIESEIWPNYIWCAKRRSIPVYLVNTRLSPRSERRYQRFRFFARPILQELDLVMAQDETDVPRLIRAGFPAESIFVVGSMKYDVADIPEDGKSSIDQWWGNCGWTRNNLILLGGSTHSGEEEIIADIYRQLKKDWPQLRLIIAPRHAERGGSVKNACENLGLKTVLRSELSQSFSNGHSPDVLVLNSTGELRSLYTKADVVFIGKSLRARGGQNFIEAARVGTPIVVGPNMQNFQNLTQEFLKQNGLIQVGNDFELSQRIRELISSPEKRKTLGEKGLEAFRQNLGAGRKTAKIIFNSLQA